MILGSGAVALAAILWGLAQQLRLEREDVVEDPIDPPPFEPMVGDDPGAFEMPAEGRAEGPIDARAARHLGLLEQLQAAIERELANLVLPDGQVPSTSTRAAAVTRTLTSLSAGSV